MTRLIALSGWRRSGKDTTAMYLEKSYGYTPISFAKKLKDSVAEQYSLPRYILDDQSLKEEPIRTLPIIPGDSFASKIQEMLRTELKSGFWTPRALCILEGSIKRSVYSNYWVASVLSEVQANPDKKYVITDMRYRTEADTIKILMPNTKMIRINRFSSIETEDPSERDLDNYPFDLVLNNAGGIGDLQHQVDIHLGPTKPSQDLMDNGYFDFMYI